ncbi:MAG: hypothetical protein IT294_17860 [Deltaproteobacteria bacterium]|nr:hypothetical protein [Deltaproteobacteria bacterium]
MTETVMAWVGPGFDGAVVVLLGALLWRLRGDAGAAWREREARLRAIFDELRALVAQSEGLARDLDAKLADRETRLRAVLDDARVALGGVESASARPARAAHGETTARPTPVAGPAAAAPSTTPADAEETARRIETLAEAGTTVEEIARRVGAAPAEVRLVIGLKAARAARRRAATAEARAHA